MNVCIRKGVNTIYVVHSNRTTRCVWRCERA